MFEKCGFPLEMKTSWTNLNPRRKFINCPRCQDAGSGRCNFFDWYDLKMCERSNELISGLLRVRREIKTEINTLHSKSRSAWKT